MCCGNSANQISDVSKIIIAQVISFIVAIILFYLNKFNTEETEKKRKVEIAKAEIISVCEKIAVYQGSLYSYTLQYYYHNRISQPDVTSPRFTIDKETSKNHAREFYSEHIKATSQLSLYKTDLVKSVAVLCSYLPEMKHILVPPLKVIRFAPDVQITAFDDPTSLEVLEELFHSKLKTRNEDALAVIDESLIKIKKLMNPSFFNE